MFVQKLRKQNGPGFGRAPLPPGFPEHQLFSEPCFHEDASALEAHMAAIFIHSERINLGVA